MLFNKLALALLSVAAVAAALPSSSSANVAPDTQVAVKRGPAEGDHANIDGRGACGIGNDGHQNISGGC